MGKYLSIQQCTGWKSPFIDLTCALLVELCNKSQQEWHFEAFTLICRKLGIVVIYALFLCKILVPKTLVEWNFWKISCLTNSFSSRQIGPWGPTDQGSICPFAMYFTTLSLKHCAYEHQWQQCSFFALFCGNLSQFLLGATQPAVEEVALGRNQLIFVCKWKQKHQSRSQLDVAENHSHIWNMGVRILFSSWVIQDAAVMVSPKVQRLSRKHPKQ